MPILNDGRGTLPLDPGYDTTGTGAPASPGVPGTRYRREDAPDGQRLYLAGKDGTWSVVEGAL